MAKVYRYAIKYIDHAGFTTGYGYAESISKYRDGEIISINGQRIKVDFELAASSTTDGHMVHII